MNHLNPIPNDQQLKAQPHILIIEAYTDANVGSCALVENSLKILRASYDNPLIRIIAQYPQAFAGLYGIAAADDMFLYPSKQPKKAQLWWLVKTCAWMLSTLLLVLLPKAVIDYASACGMLRRIESLLWADMVVSVGAERLNDKYYKSGPFSLYTLLIGKLLKKKVVIFPATIGPFFFWWSKLLTGWVLSKLDVIYTRDQASTDTLQNLLKVPAKKVASTVDVAVLQEAVSREEAIDLIGAAPGEVLVGISVMKWGYFKNSIETPFSNYKAYVSEMATTADTLIDQYGVTVVFYPTNFRMHACEDEDLWTVGQIMQLVQNKEKVRVISKLPTPSQLQAMLASSEINITTRMHACILSTNGFVPTISVNYLMKLKEYMASLGLSEFSIDIEEFSSERALEAFRRIWPERAKWRHFLEERITERKQTLWKSMERLDDLLP